MQEQIQLRIQSLRKELETGQAALQQVERQRTYLCETILRITGAIQVLEELLAGDINTSSREPGADILGVAALRNVNSE